MHSKLNLHDLHLLHAIHFHGSITAAAEAMKLSQSALSRRLQSIEQELGVQLFRRTTRSLMITPACEQLIADTAAIPNILDSAIQRMSENFLGAQKRIKMGVSSSLSLAHFPGIFHPQSRLQQSEDVKTVISQPSRKVMIRQVLSNQLDIGILTYQERLDDLVLVHHKMHDQFCAILPAGMDAPSLRVDHFRRWAVGQTWILPPKQSVTRVMLDGWLSDQDIFLSGAMELENFDLMCQLVALGMGVAFVPKRALTAFPRKRQLRHLTLQQAPLRTLAVVGPKNTVVADHITRFIGSILFS